MSLFAQMGDSTGQWGLAGDSIPVYSKVQGKTVYVRGDQAQAYVANDAVQYAKRKSTSLPKKGKPNSKETSYKPDGSKKQDRYYGPDGEPVLDVDQPHGNVDYPHAHGWTDGKNISPYRDGLRIVLQLLQPMVLLGQLLEP